MILQFYSVLFIDLLGQGEKLKLMKGVPELENDKSKYVELLKSTAGIVIEFDKFISEIIESVNISTLEDKKDRDFVDKLSGEKIKHYRNSDYFVIYYPMGQLQGKLNIYGLMKLMLIASQISIESLDKQFPVKGSICIESAININDHEIYGHVAWKSHYLESKVAKWPRIIIDDTVLQTLNSYEICNKGIVPMSGEKKITQRIVTECFSFIDRDDSGLYTINWMGFRRIDRNNRVKYIEKIQAFVNQEINKFKLQGNKKLTDRYYKLQQFVNVQSFNLINKLPNKPIHWTAV